MAYYRARTTYVLLSPRVNGKLDDILRSALDCDCRLAVCEPDEVSDGERSILTPEEQAQREADYRDLLRNNAYDAGDELPGV